MKKIVAILFGAFLSTGAMAQGALVFDAKAGVKSKMTVYDGTEVSYTAYERLFYVTNVEDSAHQFLNVYVPDGATQQTPIFLRTYVGGYMASPAAQPQAGDATGRALKEGYVVVIPGTRGRNSSIVADKAYAKAHKGVKKGQTIYTGRAPKAILDLKAAIRYLRHLDKQMPGDAERIITDGTSAGGAMSALMGATGNNPEYAELLKTMGAADERDDVFASVCYCPIIDLEHADMAYEWLFQQTDSRQSLDDTHKLMTKELAALFPAYINSLNLKKPDGTPLTADNYLDYLKSEIIRAAQVAKNAGADIPDSIGFKFTSEAGGMFAAPINGGMRPQMQGGQPPKGMRPMRGGMGRKQVGEYITDLDMKKYLNYVVSTQALKGVPAFDSQIEGINNASGENEEFGDATGNSVNFTDYTAEKNGTTLTDAIRRNVRLMNPMSFIGDGKTSVAPHWYIRHGARDRDTAFPVPVNFATKLRNAGKDVNFLLAWNRPHSGDYALDELFQWIAEITKKKGGERDPRQGGQMEINKDSDSTFVALKNETLKKFKQLTFNDTQTGKTMEYNLLVPEVAKAGEKLPLVLFMADASTAGKEVTAPLTQGYGALEFASDRDQQKHPSFVLVPQYTDWAVQDDWSTTDEVEMTIRLLEKVCKEYNVDTNRLYTTGQSMGGMMSFYFNIAHPDLFAASLFVSSQWDTKKMQDFGQKHFFYIVAGGDQKAYGGMQDLAKVLKANDARVDSASWSAKLPVEEQERLAEQLIARGGNINFIKWEAGSVLPETGRAMEHMASFDYGYKIAAVRDWLFKQSKE